MAELWDWADVAAVADVARSEGVPVEWIVSTLPHFFGSSKELRLVAQGIRYGYTEAQRDRERALAATWMFVPVPNPFDQQPSGATDESARCESLSPSAASDLPRPENLVDTSGNERHLIAVDPSDRLARLERLLREIVEARTCVHAAKVTLDFVEKHGLPRSDRAIAKRMLYEALGRLFDVIDKQESVAAIEAAREAIGGKDG